ncbi:MAG: thiamine pyrophosphate-binding protein [Sphingomonadaceae bacterium]|uniref:thiamine pyrophosphate-binding protein n=1 Tax=Thermaurantiacus sp. TaxID=2820283 RepID=UPI00298F3509|nr:thiamine pyrophosphate-binding protein [Thermaurantiacus sp.]MCS6987203.1 thiamine pyrophosphate-binding protein [Sphingomonadaceae bacterium]MDW8415763.1 thiamine pyrophosphate-binding protein [Thermaurantiacus sp.]
MGRTVATVIAEGLAAAGIAHAFCVPGESYLPLLNRLRDVPLRLVTCRHEASAAHMAEATAKLTGRPGVALVSRGPGACHAAIALHTAQQDSTPLLLLVGQVGEQSVGREAFQEMDYHRLFGAVAKRVVTLREPERAGEQLASAIACALSGRPGPVVLVLPEDRLGLPSAAPALAPTIPGPPAPTSGAVAQIARLLEKAQRPVLMLGGPGWTDEDRRLAEAVAERLGLPVVTAWRRKDRFDNRHPHYAGELGLGANPALVAALAEADLWLVVGARLTENETQGYTLFTPATAAARLVHACADADALGRVWPPRLAVHAGHRPMLEALAGLAPAARPRWVATLAGLHHKWMKPTAVARGVNPAEVVATLSRLLPDDAIVANGAGNFAAWLHRFHAHRRCGTQLAPVSGAMGYGVPAAIAAALVHPDRPAVALCGDGDFLMAVAELATVAHEGLAPLFIVLDNGQYGTIRMHQDRLFPGRPVATRLTNPDFAALASSFGLAAFTVTETRAFAPALEAAWGRAAVIHVVLDPDEIAPGRRLEADA